MHRVRFYFVLLTVALVAAACGATTATRSAGEEASSEAPTPTASSDPASEEPAPSATPEAPSPTPEPTPASSTFAVGDTITIEKDGAPWAKFTVLEVREAAVLEDPDGIFNDTPQTDGNVFLMARVRYEAITNGVDYNPFDFQIFVDGQAVENFTFVANGPQPELSSGTLPQGRTAEGWLVYEVPSQGEVLLSYSGNPFLDDAPPFEVVLREG